MSPDFPKSPSRIGALARRYAQCCIVGGTGMMVDMTVIYWLASPRMLGWNLSGSKVIAAEIALLSNFAGNEL